MALESIEGAGKYIDDLNSANPVGSTDTLAEGDNHIRGIKNVLLLTFPNLTGPMTATQAELNNLDGYTGNTADLNVLAGTAAAGVTPTEVGYLNGVTSAIQTQLDAKLTSGSIDETDMDWPNWKFASETFIVHHVSATGTSTSPTYDTANSISASMYMAIPPSATTLNYSAYLTNDDGETTYFRIKTSTNTGTAISDTGGPAQGGTLDISDKSGNTLLTFQFSRSGGTSQIDAYDVKGYFT